MTPRLPVVHINLLERKSFSLSVATLLVLVLAVTALGLYTYGRSVVAPAWEARQRSERLAGEIREVQARVAALTGEQTRNAKAVALRQEIESLEPEAQAARALATAVRAAEGGSGDEMARALTAVTTAVEPGLWLTLVTVDKAGREIGVEGQSNGGSAVLRYAHRANEALSGQELRLDSLEMVPIAASAGATTTPAGQPGTANRGLAVGAVSFKLR